VGVEARVRCPVCQCWPRTTRGMRAFRSERPLSSSRPSSHHAPLPQLSHRLNSTLNLANKWALVSRGVGVGWRNRTPAGRFSCSRRRPPGRPARARRRALSSPLGPPPAPAAGPSPPLARRPAPADASPDSARTRTCRPSGRDGFVDVWRAFFPFPARSVDGARQRLGAPARALPLPLSPLLPLSSTSLLTAARPPLPSSLSNSKTHNRACTASSSRCS
jgi:hypothetical protein